jgi:hypothetical protein
LGEYKLKDFWVYIYIELTVRLLRERTVDDWKRILISHIVESGNEELINILRERNLIETSLLKRITNLFSRH